MQPNQTFSIFLIFMFLFQFAYVISEHVSTSTRTSIAFTTLGRATYAFDIFALKLSETPTNANELKLTDGNNVNFNGQFVLTSPIHVVYVTERNGTSTLILDIVYYDDDEVEQSELKCQVQGHGVDELKSSLSKGRSHRELIMKRGLSELEVNSDLKSRVQESSSSEGRSHRELIINRELNSGLESRVQENGLVDESSSSKGRSYRESNEPELESSSSEGRSHRESNQSKMNLEKKKVSRRVQVTLAGIGQSNGKISMKDRPNVVGDDLIYVSTHEDPGVPRASWAAVYLTKWRTGLTSRLTPKGVVDFSPAVSPSGVRTAVASLGERGWNGEVDELGTDIYVFLTQDGSNRVKIVEHGGWPSWADESTLYFHRRCDDGWWSVFKAILPENGELSVDSVVTQRATPPGLHAFTPAASIANKRYIVVATRRAGSDFRHIEMYDVFMKKFSDLTRLVSPDTHHYNPFISPDGTVVGYHKCRGVGNDVGSGSLILESLQNPLSDKISLFRVGGSFPSFSPDGDRLAYVQFPGMFVVNTDGSGMREVLSGTAFTTSWDYKRKGVVYTSVGPTFASESTKVDIVSVNVDDEHSGSYKKLTQNGENNAFPSPSPDGKWVVFRSGRSGYKNLYIIDAVNGEGEGGSLYQLTEGPWSDTMCNWSPDGDWIAFASDRENPGAGSFALYKIHPNGTGLQKVIQSGSGGRTNHPWFSPDSKYIVFTSDYAGVSAEPISNPHHYQPYGDIFVIRADGSGIQRLTHNSYEDGTPAWGPKFITPEDAGWPNGPLCDFEDCHWLNISPELFRGGGDGGRGYVDSSSMLHVQRENIQCSHR
ncbi:hypothetical protein LIER_28622 [Lithospermum erythrorhizon]|uniref:Uncharacterized protein n=1 Tax=Lithospermum erythrorhizon TaxID=34254 RepID=A0AAV3RMA8_LITER